MFAQDAIEADKHLDGRNRRSWPFPKGQLQSSGIPKIRRENAPLFRRVSERKLQGVRGEQKPKSVFLTHVELEPQIYREQRGLIRIETRSDFVIEQVPPKIDDRLGIGLEINPAHHEIAIRFRKSR
jgi:hypothetical protein